MPPVQVDGVLISLGGVSGGTYSRRLRDHRIQEKPAPDVVPSRVRRSRRGEAPSGGGPAGGTEPPAQKRARFFGPKTTAPLGAPSRKHHQLERERVQGAAGSG